MKKFALAFGIFICCVLTAQDTLSGPIGDTVAFERLLGAVDILAPVRILTAQTGTRMDIPDSTVARLYPAGNLADLLGSGGSMNLKSYGPGGLSTMAMRGANSMQTPVMWNGINLQNINNNTVDLSLLPTFLFDKVNVSPGSSSAAWGSGAIGGVIQINTWTNGRIGEHSLTSPYFRVKAVGEVGSFGAFMSGLQVAGGKGHWLYDVRAYRQVSENNFPYTNIAVTGFPTEKLRHAQLFQQGFMAGVQCRPKNLYHTFSFRIWVQGTEREIPPTMLQAVNESTQQDYACRMIGTWSWYHPHTSVITRVAVIHEGLLYDAGFNQPFSNTNAWTALLESELMYYIHDKKSHLWNSTHVATGFIISESSSEVTEFIPHTNQLRASAYVSFGKYLRENDQFNITLREEIVDDQLVEPVGSAWYYYAFRRFFALRGCVSHSYRVPTFNDLYWTPGGNPDLKAETSWTEELSIEFSKKWWRTSLDYSATFYNRNVTNMISWIPLAAYWSPVNIAAVWSKGVEHRLKFTHAVDSWKFTLLVNADYVRSTYQKSDDPNDVSIGKQLIYVPAWYGGVTFTAEWKKIYVTYAQQYTDLRFTTRDHLEWLPSYSVGNAAIGWAHDYAHRNHFFSLNVFLRCNNIGDVQYQSVAWRPMPGRNFTFGFTIDFAKQKQDTPQ